MDAELVLSSSTSSGCFFLDTVTVLSEILKENIGRIDKFKKDVSLHNIPCYICDSVEKECYEKIETTLNFLGMVIREGIRVHLQESRRIRGISTASSMTSEDVIALGEIFSMLHGVAKATDISLSSPIRIIEEWAVTFLGEKLEQGVQIGIPEFLTELLKKILTVTSSIQDPYDELVTFERSFAKKISVSVNASIIGSLKSVGIHEPDATHLASAFDYQNSNNEKTVFVTLDYRTILSKQDDVRKLLKIVCSNPLYALYHLK